MNLYTAFMTTIFVIAVGGGAQAGPLAPTRASQLATLLSLFDTRSEMASAACPDNGFAGASSRAFDFRVDGSTFRALTIPPGQVFVVTDFDWEATGVPIAEFVTAVLMIETDGFNSFSAQSTARADGVGQVGSAGLLGTGIVIRAGEKLCLSVRAPLSSLKGSARGFFASDK